MKLEKHFAKRILTDDDFAHEVCETMYPALHKLLLTSMEGKLGKGFNKEKVIDETMVTFSKHPQYEGYLSLYDMVRFEGLKPYVITDSVMDKLDLLKVNKTADYFMRTRNADDVNDVLPCKTYDWSVFDRLSKRKALLILPNNEVLIIHQSKYFLGVFHLTCKILDWDKGKGHINWTVSFVDRSAKRLSPNWMSPEMQAVELYIYRLLCFMYLSENEELIVEPGHKYGTRKSGKVVNELKMPVTIVTSKWNVTSIRTEGFDVSGHFRLQPTKTGTKMIFIDPFRKHGYVRKAKSETEK